MRLWTFRQYVTEWNEWPFRDWYNAQDPHVRATFDFNRQILEMRESWTEPPNKLFEVLTKDHAPLCEIRFRADDIDRRGKVTRKRRIRIIGLLRDDDFIIFGAAEEAGHGRYIPEDAFDRALRRWRDWQDGKGRIDAVD
jgi:hypothetical protein